MDIFGSPVKLDSRLPPNGFGLITGDGGIVWVEVKVTCEGYNGSDATRSL